VKPTCTTCLNKCIECVWPKEGGDKLPTGYRVPEADMIEKSKVKKKALFVPVEFKTKSSDLVEPEFSEESINLSTTAGVAEPFNNFADQIYDIGSPGLIGSPGSIGSPEPLEFSLDQENFSCSSSSLTRSNSPTIPFTITLYNQFSPDHEQRFKLACVNGFIQSVGPQYTHPLLTTTATFSPFVDNNSITQKVAAACGCAFLSWQNPELTTLSAQKYYIAFNALDGYMKDHPVDSYMENWLGAAFQLMCLCSKITWNCSPSNAVNNLVNSYKMIEMRFLAKSKAAKKRKLSISNLTNGTSQEEQGITHYLKDFKSDNLKMEIENSLIHIDKFSSEYFESQFEKMFIESFIFNYSIAILVADNYYLLPNPFNVFRDLRHLLKAPLFNCDVAWMNNPVFGASIDAFELAAKASYLLRNLNDPQMLVTAKKLYDSASFYPTPMIPSEIRIDSTKYKSLRDSVLMAEIVAKASKILLRKLIIPELSDKDDPVIQNDLSTVLSKLKAITPNSRVKVIGCFPLLVAGAAAHKEDQRKLLIENLVKVGDMTHGRHVYTVVDALKISWGRSPECGTIKTRGLDIFFDRRVMSKVIV